jgi:sugar phosphate permease
MSLTGLANIAFGMGNTVPWFTACWVLNALFQGCGGSPAAKILMNWFPAAIRGKWWSAWNSSANIGGFTIPLLAGGMASAFGWRYGMFAPGVLAVVCGFLSYFVMKDEPQKMGLPSPEAIYARSHGLPEISDEVGAPNPASDVLDDDEKESVLEMLMRNKFLWCMSAMHFFLYFMRQGTMNWAAFYFMEHFGIDAKAAAARITGFEAGGLFGSVSSGLLSDFLIQRNPKAGAAGMRARVMFLYALLSPAAIYLLWKSPPTFISQWFAMALFGFSVYGPQTLITMTGCETVSRRLAASTSGLLSYPAQFGAMAAGLPLAMMVKKMGWGGFFPALLIMGACNALAVLPGFNEPSYKQRKSKLIANKNATSTDA